jgi:WD40 repeat protein
MISGRAPYLADSAMTIMMMVLNDPLPDLRDLRDGVPEALLAVVQRALSKEPPDRFQTMGEMADALNLPPEQLQSAPLAATVVDQDQSDPAFGSLPGISVTDSEPKPEVREISTPLQTPEKVEFPQPEPLTSAPAEVPLADQYVQTEPETRITRSNQPVTRSKSKLSSAKKLILILGLLFVISVFAAVIVFINEKQPDILLTPISQPQNPIDLQTAKSVVNLGTWAIDSHIESIALSPDGFLLGTANNRDSLPISRYRFYSGLWQIETGSLRGYNLRHQQWVYDVAFTPDSLLFGTASDDATVKIWENKNGDIKQTIDASFGGFTCLDFSSNNKLLAAGSWDGVVGLWQLENGNLLRKLQADDNSIRDIDFSPDGQLLAAASDNNSILLWRVSDGSLLHTLQGHTDIVYRIAFSPNGSLLASASEDYTIRLWRVDDGSFLRTFQGHTDSVYDVAFTLDGSLLASGSADGTLRLWDVSNGHMVNTLTEHNDDMTSVVFSPDNHLLVSGAADGIINFWGISDAIPLETE